MYNLQFYSISLIYQEITNVGTLISIIKSNDPSIKNWEKKRNDGKEERKMKD